MRRWVGAAYTACLALIACAGHAENVFYFNERFDVTLYPPVSFVGDEEAGEQFLFLELQGGDVQLELVAASPPFGTIQEEFALTVDARQALGDRIFQQVATANSFDIFGSASPETSYMLRTLIGATCEGDPVIATVTITFPRSAAPEVVDTVLDLIESLHIGACG